MATETLLFEETTFDIYQVMDHVVSRIGVPSKHRILVTPCNNSRTRDVLSMAVKAKYSPVHGWVLSVYLPDLGDMNIVEVEHFVVVAPTEDNATRALIESLVLCEDPAPAHPATHITFRIAAIWSSGQGLVWLPRSVTHIHGPKETDDTDDADVSPAKKPARTKLRTRPYNTPTPDDDD